MLNMDFQIVLSTCRTGFCIIPCFSMFRHVHLQVKLLKDILEAWKKEVEKKPSSLTIEEAYETLKVKTDPSG